MATICYFDLDSVFWFEYQKNNKDGKLAYDRTISTMDNLSKDHAMVICRDGKYSWRKKFLPTWKERRYSEERTEAREDLSDVWSYAGSCGYDLSSEDGYDACDVIASRIWADQPKRCLIYTTSKLLLQLCKKAPQLVEVKSHITKDMFGEREVLGKLGVAVPNLGSFLAMVGDGDIPGIKGIGPRKAQAHIEAGTAEMVEGIQPMLAAVTLRNTKQDYGDPPTDVSRETSQPTVDKSVVEKEEKTIEPESESEPTPTLASALVEAQRLAMGVHKGSKNKFQNYNYASAEAVIAEARAALNSAGLSLSTIETELRPVSVKDEANPGATMVGFLVSTHLLEHRGGESRQYVSTMPVVCVKGRPVDKTYCAALTTDLAYFLRNLLLLPRLDENPIDQRDDRNHRR